MNAPSLLPPSISRHPNPSFEATEPVTPLVFMQESDAQYQLRFPSSSVNRARMEAKILENVLTISGEFGIQNPRPFRRTFSLPHPVSNEQPRIQESNGYVTVQVNKHAVDTDTQ